MSYAILGLLGYLLGSFPTGVFLSKRRYGIDVRETGSGNIGATNVTRTFGWYAGLLTLLVDFLKGFVPLFLIRRYFPAEPWLLPLVATTLVFGHCFSAYLKLEGGKGVATSFGCLTAVQPWAAVFCLCLYLVLLIITRISAVGSLAGLIGAVAYAFVMSPPAHVKILILAVCSIVLVRHQSNVRRLVREFRKREG